MHTYRKATTPSPMLGGYELQYGLIYLAETPVLNTAVDRGVVYHTRRSFALTSREIVFDGIAFRA
jgi:hypothetical protein